jgi:hypothetical protein
MCLNEACLAKWATRVEFEDEAARGYEDETELLRTHLKTEVIKLINQLPPEQLKEFAAWLAEAKQKLAVLVN